MKTVTLPEAVIFGTMIGLGLTGFLLAKETRPWYIYILLALVNCFISILVYAGADALAAWLGGMTNADGANHRSGRHARVATRRAGGNNE